METLAADFFPEPALKALMGLGLQGASNWSLRAAGRRTTLLLVWDNEKEEKGNLKFRRGRGRRQSRRENQPTESPHPTHYNLKKWSQWNAM
ncbi:hypothetical protein ACJMK2_032006 [Sinanodonta woodiana]|uniref:Uncharacterized protein n=1 Tax=Sinanodonta woodiana TaxID=1069815 RepID=A0ABD3X1W6_SINWO